MLAILLSLTLSEEIDSTKIKETTHPSYNVMAYNTEDVKRKKKKKGKKMSGKCKKKKKGFFSKIFGSK